MHKVTGFFCGWCASEWAKSGEVAYGVLCLAALAACVLSIYEQVTRAARREGR